MHIEQGPQLEEGGVPIGIVDAIFGRRLLQITFRGQPAHAGTTPLDMRADALLGAANFVVRASKVVGSKFPGAVVTCGDVRVKPGVANVVPGQATVVVEFRASEMAVLDVIEEMLNEVAAESATGPGGLSYDVAAVDSQAPVAMSPTIKAAIQEASDELSIDSMVLSSGALHDAGILARTVAAGMIFVPSIGGQSHTPAEDTDPADMVVGANILLQSVLILARRLPL